VLIACWSVKGGSGTTVMAAAFALLAAKSSPDGALLVDLEGDSPAALGLTEPVGPGVADWLRAPTDVSTESLSRLEVEASTGLRLLPAGAGGLEVRGDRAALLGATLAADPRTVVVDCGVGPAGAGLAVAAAAELSLLVVRPCYLALRRVAAAPLRPTGLVLVNEPSRALGRADIEDATGLRVLAQVDADPAVARAVDAGLLAQRLPRSLAHGLRRAA
jgi:MinD-like ATPase involved in chromosome partitioning or flagellar assembly